MKQISKPGFLFSLLFTIFSFFRATVHLDNTSLWQPEKVKGKDETRRMRRTSHDRHMLPLQFLKRNLVISWNATGTLLCVQPWWEKKRCTALPSFPECLHVLVVESSTGSTFACTGNNAAPEAAWWEALAGLDFLDTAARHSSGIAQMFACSRHPARERCTSTF